MIIDNESCSQKIINNLQTNNIDYIDRIQILYKNNKKKKYKFYNKKHLRF
jgi:hypothetical protein